MLQNTRLCLVMQIADSIARSLALASATWLQQYPAAATSEACALEQQTHTYQV